MQAWQGMQAELAKGFRATFFIFIFCQNFYLKSLWDGNQTVSQVTESPLMLRKNRRVGVAAQAPGTEGVGRVLAHAHADNCDAQIPLPSLGSQQQSTCMLSVCIIYLCSSQRFYN